MNSLKKFQEQMTETVNSMQDQLFNGQNNSVKSFKSQLNSRYASSYPGVSKRFLTCAKPNHMFRECRKATQQDKNTAGQKSAD